MNLTPTEKAKELVLQFYEVVKNKYPSTSGMPLAKQCALIAIKHELESIMLLNLLCTFDNPMKPHFEQKITELKEIKTEIEKL